MSEHSSIEWTDATWNPVRGCTKISPGCKHCYAETFTERFRGVPGHPFEQGFELRLVFDKLAEPLRWGRSRTVFVNSMSDLFHERVPDAYISAVFEVMRVARWHTYQVLTKRADRLRAFTRAAEAGLVEHEHVWLGVSVENRKHGLPRIDALREARAGKRFLSIEPLLEDLGEFDLEGIDWVIVGGESGRGAREMAPEWAEAIRDRCRAAKVPFFFKQWGGVNKKQRGRTLAGRTHDAMPRIRRANPPTLTERRALLAEFELQTGDLPTLLGPRRLVTLRPPRAA
jgi:protein gp37